MIRLLEGTQRRKEQKETVLLSNDGRETGLDLSNYIYTAILKFRFLFANIRFIKRIV